MGLGLSIGFLFFGSVGWIVLKGSKSAEPERGTGGSGNSGFSTADKPVPLNPNSPHHLGAAKELPPSDKTHSLPKD